MKKKKKRKEKKKTTPREREREREKGERERKIERESGPTAHDPGHNTTRIKPCYPGPHPWSPHRQHVFFSSSLSSLEAEKPFQNLHTEGFPHAPPDPLRQAQGSQSVLAHPHLFDPCLAGDFHCLTCLPRIARRLGKGTIRPSDKNHETFFRFVLTSHTSHSGGLPCCV